MDIKSFRDRYHHCSNVTMMITQRSNCGYLDHEVWSFGQEQVQDGNPYDDEGFLVGLETFTLFSRTRVDCPLAIVPFELDVVVSLSDVEKIQVPSNPNRLCCFCWEWQSLTLSLPKQFVLLVS